MSESPTSEDMVLYSIKSISKNILDPFFRSENVRIILGKLLYPFMRFNEYLNTIPLRAGLSSAELKAVMDDLSKSMVVRTGPFAGMKYGGLESIGSSLYPKLLGLYEKEIHPAIYKIIDADYTSIVDIGCAEGYYAVGFALKCKTSLIYAFDTDKNARLLCAKNAKANNLSLSIRATCSPDELGDLDLGAKPLVFMDCEGYEKQFFKQITKHLLESDFFLELHDFMDLNIRAEIIDLLACTHDIEIFSSIDDIDKAYEYESSLCSHLKLEDRFFLFKENRPSIMKWIYARRKICF